MRLGLRLNLFPFHLPFDKVSCYVDELDLLGAVGDTLEDKCPVYVKSVLNLFNMLSEVSFLEWRGLRNDEVLPLCFRDPDMFTSCVPCLVEGILKERQHCANATSLPGDPLEHQDQNPNPPNGCVPYASVPGRPLANKRKHVFQVPARTCERMWPVNIPYNNTYFTSPGTFHLLGAASILHPLCSELFLRLLAGYIFKYFPTILAAAGFTLRSLHFPSAGDCILSCKVPCRGGGRVSLGSDAR